MTDPESEWKLSGEFSALLKTEKKKKAGLVRTDHQFVADFCLFSLKNFQGPSGSFVLFLSLQLCMEQLRVLI